jgi:hypothetical protein
MASPEQRRMVRMAKCASEDDLLLAMTSGSPQDDPELGFSQAVAGAELQRRAINRLERLIGLVGVGLAVVQILLAILVHH